MADLLRPGRQVVVRWWDHSSPGDWQSTDPADPALAVIVGKIVSYCPKSTPPYLVVSRCWYPQEGRDVDLVTILLDAVEEIRPWRAGRTLAWTRRESDESD